MNKIKILDEEFYYEVEDRITYFYSTTEIEEETVQERYGPFGWFKREKLKTKTAGMFTS